MQEEWKTINSREVHKNHWYKLMEDDTIMPSGQQGKYTYVDRLPAVVIIALNENNEIYLVGQYRYPIKKFSWEVPMGTTEKEDKEIIDSAKRELLEEVGLEAKKWIDLGIYYFTPGISNQIAHIYLAQDLEQKSAMPDYTEFLTSKKITLEKVEEMIGNGEIFDSPSIAAFYFLKLYLEKNKSK